MFSYYLYKDAGKTGRFEVTLFKNQPASDKGTGVLVFSKEATNKMPADDYATFLKGIDDALK